MPASVSSYASNTSKTAAEIIQEQLSLEAEAREALPYQFDTCTQPLGAIRQSLFSCLTCNPPPSDPAAPYSPAGVCYSCSISCHGEHNLVELFGKRNFVCDCGTTRLPETAPCTLRISAKTGQKGDVTGEVPAEGNRYNQNFRNKFCGCGEEYDPQQEKGTMFQCLGLGTAEEGGCGEDWWHPECIMGLNREEYKKSVEEAKAKKRAQRQANTSAEGTSNGEGQNEAVAENTNGTADQAAPPKPVITAENGIDGNESAAEAEEEEEDDDDPMPPGFPAEDDFDNFICYKCVETHPWIKRYAGTEGFLPPVHFGTAPQTTTSNPEPAVVDAPAPVESKKRKAEDDPAPESSTTMAAPAVKRQKSEDPSTTLASIPETEPTSTAAAPTPCKLPPTTSTTTATTIFSLFLTPDFRSHLCHCPTHFPFLTPHPQLLEEEETYSPPVSEADEGERAGSIGTGSIYDRGEAAFSTMDRVQAIQGAMAYAHLKDGLKAFLQPFAESGKAVGAEDIKAYFEKLRGDEAGIREAAEGAGGDEGGDGRREQSGY